MVDRPLRALSSAVSGPGRGPRWSDAIGPTAHYTSAVWARHGLSHPAFVTDQGRALYHAARPGVALGAALHAPTLEGFLVARHRLIDHLLAEAIDAGRVAQVLEVACGLSPRGWRFVRRYGDRLTYVEADLPPMAARKRRALERAGAGGPRHRVAEVDALRADGPLSVGAVAATLDPGEGLAIVTEGLIHYLDRRAVVGMWGRFAAAFDGFPDGVYLSDVHLTTDAPAVARWAFVAGLSAFVRGPVHLHMRDEADVVGALRVAGFGRAVLHRPADFADRVPGCDDPGARVVRVIEAG